MSETLLIIDGHSMAFRAFYALPADNFQANGQHTNAVYGFVSMLVKQLEDEKPDRIAVAFDLSRHSFRTEEYPEYKGTRGETPPEFRGQIELIQEILAAMGIPSLTKENYEADDILATLATEGAARGWRVLVASGDRDTFQLVNDHVTVLYPGQRATDLRHMTPEAIEEKYGVRPEQYPEIAAIVGETSDNLPGVPGVGPKTAAQWINKYGSLDALLEHADEIGGKRGEALREHESDVRRNRKLNRLLTDLDVGVDVDDIVRGATDMGTINSLFDSLEIGALRNRVKAVAPIGSGAAGPIDEDGAAADATTAADAPSWADPVVTVCEPGTDVTAAVAELGDDLALWVDGVGRPAAGDVRLLALSNGESAFVVDAAELSPGQEKAIGEVLSADGRFTVHAGKSAWHACQGRGWTLGQPADDVELSAYLLHPEQRSYDVPTLVQGYLGHDFEAEASGGDADALFGEDLLTDASDAQIHAAARAAAVLLPLRDEMAKRIEADGETELLDAIEIPLEGILANMEHLGIAIDADVLAEQASELSKAVQKAAADAFDVIGHEVNLSSPKQLQEVLFDELGMPKTKKTKTGYTTNADALQQLFEKTQHPFLEHLLAHRDRIKLLQMVETLKAAVAPDGRIHTTFSQTVTATGRLASSDPNLQNIPARTPDGLRIRDGFVAGPGYEDLMSADYSQIEMRIMAHLSGDQALIDAFTSGEDLHKTMASMVFGVPVDEVTHELRNRIKATSYGLAYGLSSFGLSQQLGVDVGEANELRDRYFDRFGKVRDYLDEVVAQARKDGYTATMFNRRRYLPDLNSDNRQRRDMAERAALNAPIQGSAADIIKVAMIKVCEAMRAKDLKSRLLLQIHDELIVEIAPGEKDVVQEVVTDAMTHAVLMDVPLEVAVGVGHSWKAAAH